jgi:arylsulfatase A-like enzyme
VDLLPTICAITGAKLPERKLDGADITPIFEGKEVKRPHSLYWQYDFAISRPWVVSLRDGAWKLMADARLEKFELYNLVDDVGEKKDLAGEHAERVLQMAARMKLLHEEIKAEGAKSGNPAPKLPKK